MIPTCAFLVVLLPMTRMPLYQTNWGWLGSWRGFLTSHLLLFLYQTPLGFAFRQGETYLSLLHFVNSQSCAAAQVSLQQQRKLLPVGNFVAVQAFEHLLLYSLLQLLVSVVFVNATNFLL